MKQQVNLYLPELREKKVVFSTLTMLQFTGLFLILFSGLYVFQLYKIKPFEQQLETLSTELQQLQQQVEAMESAQKKDAKTKLLDNEIAKLSSQLEQKELIAELLGSRSFGNEAGFSAYLESFARGHVQGTWLTGVDIKAGGSLLGLEGKTLSSELVPMYLQRLAEEESLQGSAFNVLEIARKEQKDGDTEINFLISTN